MEPLAEMFTSKKFIAAIASVIGGLVARLGFNVDVETIGVIILPLVVYIFAQGQADKGKAAAVIVAANPAPVTPPSVVEQTVNVEGDTDKTPTQPL